jgi:hypothetical protein
MNRAPWLLGLFAVGLAMLVAAPASTTVIQYLDIEQMSELADVITTGEVERVQASWNDAHTKIYTRITVRTEEVIKGDRELDTVTLKLIGGKVGEHVARLPGTPVFEPGDEVLLFLEAREDQDGYLVLGLFQGLYRLDDDTDSDDLLYQDLPPRGVSIIDNQRHPAASRMCTLAEIRRIVKGGAR